MTHEPLDLGDGVTLNFTSWGEHDRVGYLLDHSKPDGSECEGGAGLFDLPGVREAFPGRAVWQIESWEPLTLSPSLLCSACGHHGFVRQGQWVPA